MPLPLVTPTTRRFAIGDRVFDRVAQREAVVLEIDNTPQHDHFVRVDSTPEQTPDAEVFNTGWRNEYEYCGLDEPQRAEPFNY